MYSNLFSPDSIAELTVAMQTQFPKAIWETFYVTLLSTALAVVIGLPLGVLLVAGEKGGVLPLPKALMSILNVIINLLRSIPFLILMIMVFPLSRLSSARPSAPPRPSFRWSWRRSRSSRALLKAACARSTPTSLRPRRAWAQRPCRSSAR